MKYFLTSFLLMFSLSVMAFDNACPQQDKDRQLFIVGFAVDKKTQQPLYCEYHFSSEDAQKVKVEYRTLDNALIAQKALNYSLGLLSPAVTQEDLRHGELREAKPLGSGNLQLAYRKPNTQALQKQTVETEGVLVIDAGFDQAVKRYWDQLNTGENLIIDFASPIHLKTFRLSIARSEDLQQCLSVDYVASTQACFLIRPANGFLQLFVSPLALIYDRKQRRLTTYIGNVNITDQEGKTPAAVIQYSYNTSQ